MYQVFVNGDWYDYGWLRAGCIDEQHFNWFYSLWTAHNPHVRNLIEEGPYRKFVASAGEYLIDDKDMVSHYKRFCLHNVENHFDIKIGDKLFFL